MSRERVLRRRIHTLETLGEAVKALRSLSARSFRVARERLPAVRAYRAEVDRLLGVLEPEVAPAPAGSGRPAVVLVAADLGLCGDYNRRLVREALDARAALGGGRLFCLGRRAEGPLRNAGVEPDRVLPAPAGPGSLPRVLLPLVDEILGSGDGGAPERLVLVGARFEGAGRFTPRRTVLLPVAPAAEQPTLAPSPFVGRAHLRQVLVREFLYVALTEALLEALASEHGTRLVIAETARSWIEDRTARLVQQAAEIRRETSTQEVLELVAGSRIARGGRGRRKEGPWTTRS